MERRRGQYGGGGGAGGGEMGGGSSCGLTGQSFGKWNLNSRKDLIEGWPREAASLLSLTSKMGLFALDQTSRATHVFTRTDGRSSLASSVPSKSSNFPAP